MMAACSNDELVEKTDNNDVDGKETEWHANVRLVLPSVAGAKTRAEERKDDPSFDDGAQTEYNIIKNECYFEAFDEGGHRIGAASGAGIEWEKDQIETDNVTLTGNITIRSSLKPASVVCFLNLKSDLMPEIKKMGLEGLKSKQTLSGFDGTKEVMNSTFARLADGGGFFMTNSSYFDTYGNTVKEVSVKDNIYKQGEDEREPVTIHVERVVAKATADIKLADNAKAKKKTMPDGSVFYELTCDNATGDGSETVDFGVKFLAWGLNATNRSFLPLKNIEGVNSLDFGTHAPNSPSFGRSYWAIDGNYEIGDGNYLSNVGFSGMDIVDKNLDLNYYSLNKTTNTLGNDVAEYCFENTMNGAVTPKYGCATHVIFKAQYTDENGNANGKDVYRLGQGIYTAEALKKYILVLLQQHVADGTELNANDIVLDRQKTQYKERADVKTIIKCSNDNVTFNEGVDKNDLGKTIFADRDCWVYPEGLCYYTIPIKHFASLNNSEQTGYFGVVRNHWYQVNVTDILEFGHPADPDKPIVPEDIEDNEWLLKCDIKVLAWGKVNVDASVGDNSGWQ